MESLYDYGSRAGFWRLHRLFTSRKVPCTVFAVGMVRAAATHFISLESFLKGTCKHPSNTISCAICVQSSSLTLQALERNPAVCRALKETTSWEVASHGYRWIDYRAVDEETERDHIWRTVQIHERLLGKRPVGMYQGKVCLACIHVCTPVYFFA